MTYVYIQYNDHDNQVQIISQQQFVNQLTNFENEVRLLNSNVDYHRNNQQLSTLFEIYNVSDDNSVTFHFDYSHQVFMCRVDDQQHEVDHNDNNRYYKLYHLDTHIEQLTQQQYLDQLFNNRKSTDKEPDDFAYVKDVYSQHFYDYSWLKSRDDNTRRYHFVDCTLYAIRPIGFND